MELFLPDDKLVTLASFDGEIEAILVVNELRHAGIPAEASGVLAAGFRAETPGNVKVLIYEESLAEAQHILDDYNASLQEIDWDQVDVGEMEDESPEPD